MQICKLELDSSMDKTTPKKAPGIPFRHMGVSYPMWAGNMFAASRWKSGWAWLVVDIKPSKSLKVISGRSITIVTTAQLFGG